MQTEKFIAVKKAVSELGAHFICFSIAANNKYVSGILIAFQELDVSMTTSSLQNITGFI